MKFFSCFISYLFKTLASSMARIVSHHLLQKLADSLSRVAHMYSVVDEWQVMIPARLSMNLWVFQSRTIGTFDHPDVVPFSL